MMQNIDALSYNLLKSSLDATSERGRVIAHNIANVNTKGYKAKKVVFENKLNDVLSGRKISLKTTNNKHINASSSGSDLSPEIVTDNSTSMKLDGNNVDIENEMTNLAANNIMYNALVSQANSKISMRRYVISEGRK